MSNITLEEFAKLLKSELKPIKETLEYHSELLNKHSDILNEHTDMLNRHSGILGKHTETLNKHYIILDELVTEKRKRDEDKAVRDYRVSNLEEWAGKAAKKLNLKFEV